MPTLHNNLNKILSPKYGIAKAVLFLLFFFYAGAAFSQDVIITVAGSHIKCNVQDIGDDSISYTDFGISAAKLRSLPRKDIYIITYHNNAPADTITKPVAIAVKKVKPAPAAPSPVTTAPVAAIATNNATIFTTDGKQIACNVTEIDDNIINYQLAGSTTALQIDTLNVSVIKYTKGGDDDVFNRQGKRPALTAAGRANKKPDEAMSMAAILQNWKRKYISPPLEIF